MCFNQSKQHHEYRSVVCFFKNLQGWSLHLHALLTNFRTNDVNVITLMIMSLAGGALQVQLVTTLRLLQQLLLLVSRMSSIKLSFSARLQPNLSDLEAVVGIAVPMFALMVSVKFSAEIVAVAVVDIVALTFAEGVRTLDLSLMVTLLFLQTKLW